MLKFILSALLMCIGSVPTVAAQLPDFLANTPVGSWVTTQDTSSSDKLVTQSTRSLVGEKTIDGIRYVWLETNIQQYKNTRSGKLKPKGDATGMKALMEASLLQSDMSNVLSNLQKFGRELYIKTGDGQVMDMSNLGALAQALTGGMGTKIEFDISATGEKKDFKTSQGTVKAEKYLGVGDAEIKIVIRTMKVHTETDMWLSDQVPFGLVESTSNNTINGKLETSHSQLIDFGFKGAVSQIDESQAVENPLGNFQFPGS